ncbi:hypothetical protein [Clostridium tunisiense]|uniref:hypothetical protein n=1 Tax=Clostridium tunisiense TaxID=219748 RepID=UPI0002E3848A|nr:hypothetical protein [Clostridium tunisiense]
MDGLNCKSLHHNGDERFLLFLYKREKAPIYDLYFVNKSGENLTKVEVTRKHSTYNNFLEANFVDTIGTKVIRNIGIEEQIQVGDIKEQDNKVDDFEFIFNIYLEGEIVSFSKIINRRKLLLGLIEVGIESEKSWFNIMQETKEIKDSSFSMDTIVDYFERKLKSKSSSMPEAEWLELMKAFNLLKPYIYEYEDTVKTVIDTSLIDWQNYFSGE